MPANEHLFTPRMSIKINGQLVPDLDRDILEIVVEDSLYLPDMFLFRLIDQERQWIDSKLLAIGNKVELVFLAPTLQAKASTDLEGETLIIGEITSLEAEFAQGVAPVMGVRGYDLSYRLHQGKQTRSFLKMTDSEVAQKIAGEMGLKAEVDPTKPIHEYIAQNNQTNMALLRELARRNGYQLYVEDQTLYFKRGNQKQEGVTTEEPPKLEWGVNLAEFYPRITGVHQVKEVIVRGWDPMSKQEVVGQVSKSDSYPEIQGRDLLGKIYGGTEKLIVSRPVKTQEEAQALAQAIHDEMSGDFIQAEGQSDGDPRIQSGKLVEVTGLGERFSGKYFVTVSVHHYELVNGYKTSFTIGGRKAETLTELLGGSCGDGAMSNGVRVGLVTQNKDNEGLGRVKVKFPTFDDQDESAWARIASPMAGGNRGFFVLPEVNDEVLVAFEQGDIHRPYILGMLWNGKDKPPLSSAVGGDGQVNQRAWRSRSGHEIILDDSSGSEKITINAVGKGDLAVETSGDVTIKSKGNVKIEATAGVSIDSKGDVSITSTANVNIKGTMINLN